MGKAQKIKVSKKNQVASVAPLGDQLQSAEVAAPSGRVKERNRLDEDEDYVESRLSKNIITQARLQVFDPCTLSIKALPLEIMPWLSQRFRTHSLVFPFLRRVTAVA